MNIKMKKSQNMKKSIIIACVVALGICISGALFAQPNPHSQSNGSAVGGNSLGAGAPVAGGATLLITFSVACALGCVKWPK